MLWFYAGVVVPYLLFLTVLVGFKVFRNCAALLVALLSRTPETTEDKVPAPEIICILVHGTWARRARWTLPGSDLRTSLSQLGQVQFKRFRWSGRNTYKARIRAELKLKVMLEESLLQNPRLPHYVIAHSHGGNIAIRAASSYTETVRVVCLSTPFIVASSRPQLDLTNIIVFWSPIVVIINIFYSLEQAQILYEPNGLYVCALGFLISKLLSLVSDRLTPKIQESLRFPKINKDNVLIVRSMRDEASLFLSTSQLIGYILYALLDRPLGLLQNSHDTLEQFRLRSWDYRWIPQTIFLISLIYLTASIYFSGLSLPAVLFFCALILGFLSTLFFVFQAAGGMAAIIIGVPVLTVIFAPLVVGLYLLVAVVGYELWLVMFRLNISCEATPPGEWKIFLVSEYEGELF